MAFIDLYYAQFRFGYFYLWMEPIELKEQLSQILKLSEMDTAMRVKLKSFIMDCRKMAIVFFFLVG